MVKKCSYNAYSTSMALCCTFMYTKNTRILAPAIKANLQNKRKGVLIGTELLALTRHHIPLQLPTSPHPSTVLLAVQDFPIRALHCRRYIDRKIRTPELGVVVFLHLCKSRSSSAEAECCSRSASWPTLNFRHSSYWVDVLSL